MAALVFIAAVELSLVALSRDYSSCSPWASLYSGFFCSTAQALEPGLSSWGSLA